jgi:AcrR family transcriptional regulator
MSAIEHGRTPLTVTRLERIAELLGVSTTSLLRGETPAGARTAGEPADWRHYDDLDLGPILQAALRLFVRTGFHATSMREIAAEAGVSVAGIYHHHAGKQEILAKLLEATMAEIGWRVRAARDGGTGPEDAFARMVESLALFHALRGDLAFLGATEMRGLAEPDLTRITAMRDEVQHLLDAQAARAFPGAEIRTACRAIATMCTSLPSWFRLDGPMSADQVAKEYSRYALAMLRRPR